MESKDHSILYTGILLDYILDNNGKLDRVLLSNMNRKILNFQSGENEQRQIIPGDFMSFPYAEVKNINITYLQIEDLPVNTPLPDVTP